MLSLFAKVFFFVNKSSKITFSVPGMGDLGTKNALIVPGAHGNARAGTKTASSVPTLVFRAQNVPSLCPRSAKTASRAQKVTPMCPLHTSGHLRIPRDTSGTPLRICRAAVLYVTFIFLVENVDALLEGVNFLLKAMDAFEIFGPFKVCKG